MKKYLVLLLISTFTFGQVNTTTTTAGKYKMNIPDLGAKKDSAVVWDGVSKLLKIIPVSQIKGTTNLDYIATPVGGTVYSSSGNDAILPLVTTINAGLQSPSDKTKLNGIANGATANSTDAALRDRSTHTGTQSISTVAGLQTSLDTKVDKVTGKGLSTEDYTTAEKTKLSNIANGATANSTDVALRDRSTHTGTQAISTVIGLQAAIDAKINISLIGANNGVAPLDAGGKVPFANLPAALMIYKGMWNPNTNTPTLSDGTGVAGWVYKVSVDGSANLGSGTISYLAGDFLIHNGTKWERSAGTDNVVSVNGQQGVVILTTANISDSTNKRYQTDAQQAYNDATSSIQTQLNGKQPAGSYESAFSKNTAFNKSFGTAAGTVAEGNDSRINNGQTAYGWGNHASKGYVVGVADVSATDNTIVRRSSDGLAAIQAGYLEMTYPSVDASSIADFVTTAGNGVLRRNSASTVKTFLGLGSNAYTSTAYLPLTGGMLSGNLTIDSGYGVGFSLNDGFSILRQAGSTQFNYGGIPKLNISVDGIESVAMTIGKVPTGVVASIEPNIQTKASFTQNSALIQNRDNDIFYPMLAGYNVVSNFGYYNVPAFGFMRPSDNSNGDVVIRNSGDGLAPVMWKFKPNGDFVIQGSVIASAFFQSSDRRLKNILMRDGDVAYFTWKDKRDTKTHIGYIAQEVKKEFPDQVQKGTDGMLSVNYVEILVAKIQDLEKRVKELENRK